MTSFVQDSEEETEGRAHSVQIPHEGSGGTSADLFSLMTWVILFPFLWLQFTYG